VSAIAEIVVQSGAVVPDSAGAKHDACTTTGMKVLATNIIEKGKPLGLRPPD
jgi:hypothetical protein